jgi:hypothetical protein
MAKDAFRNYTGPEKRNTFLRGFYKGAVQGIEERLRSDEAERKSQEQLTIENKDMGLMIVSEKKQVIQYIAENFKVRSVAQKGLMSQDGRSQGLAAGRTMGIHAGLNSGGGGQRRLN